MKSVLVLLFVFVGFHSYSDFSDQASCGLATSVSGVFKEKYKVTCTDSLEGSNDVCSASGDVDSVGNWGLKGAALGAGVFVTKGDNKTAAQVGGAGGVLSGLSSSCVGNACRISGNGCKEVCTQEKSLCENYHKEKGKKPEFEDNFLDANEVHEKLYYKLRACEGDGDKDGAASALLLQQKISELKASVEKHKVINSGETECFKYTVNKPVCSAVGDDASDDASDDVSIEELISVVKGCKEVVEDMKLKLNETKAKPSDVECQNSLNDTLPEKCLCIPKIEEALNDESFSDEKINSLHNLADGLEAQSVCVNYLNRVFKETEDLCDPDGKSKKFREGYDANIQKCEALSKAGVEMLTDGSLKALAGGVGLLAANFLDDKKKESTPESASIAAPTSQQSQIQQFKDPAIGALQGQDGFQDPGAATPSIETPDLDDGTETLAGTASDVPTGGGGGPVDNGGGPSGGGSGPGGGGSDDPVAEDDDEGYRKNKDYRPYYGGSGSNTPGGGHGSGGNHSVFADFTGNGSRKRTSLDKRKFASSTNSGAHGKKHGNIFDQMTKTVQAFCRAHKKNCMH